MYDHHDTNEAPVRKKARVEAEDFTTKRTDALIRKIEDLTQEFPEMKYILDQSDLKKIIEPAVLKYRHEVKKQGNEINSPIYMLPDEILEKCFSYVGEGSYLLVAPVSTKFCKVYKDMLKDNEKMKLPMKWLRQAFLQQSIALKIFLKKEMLGKNCFLRLL